jgi:hypothetical protein
MVASQKILRAGAAAAAALACNAIAQRATAQITPAPHIVARPDSVMVNGTTMLTGTGFPADSLVHLQECGSAMWIVPEDPCDTTNEITVMSGPSGRFSTPFKVQLCPRKLPPKPPVTREKCYIGEPQPSGIDTIRLLGAAKIIVTYP